MNHVRRQLTRLHLWAVLLVLGAVQVAHAQGTASCTQWKYTSYSGYYTGGWKTTAQEACTSTADALNAANPSRFYTGVLVGPLPVCRLTFVTVPPGGSGTDGDSNPQTQVGACSLPCPEAGTKKIINVTAGYVTSANGSADVLNLPSLATRIGQTMCASAGGSSCSYTIGQPVDSWSSTQPTTTGLYRISDDWEMISTGASCSPSAQETATTDATAPPPSCPGAFGAVNGKPVCVPTSGGTTAKPAASTNNRAGNPAAGSDGTQPIGNRSPTTGTNNANNGSASAPTDGTPLGGRDTGIPPAAGTSAGAGGGTVNVEIGDIPTDCDKKPNSIGCSEYGTPDNGVSLSQLDSGFGGITPVAFGTSSGCPVPASFTVAGSTYDISFQPICDGAESYIRPIVLVLGAAAAAFIFVGGFRS